MLYTLVFALLNYIYTLGCLLKLLFYKASFLIILPLSLIALLLYFLSLLAFSGVLRRLPSITLAIL